ncbi:MAG: Nramp family divalent metal transporter [Bryobacteraceae bacterium]
MASGTQASKGVPGRRGWWGFLASVGPGLIFALSGIGARDLIVNSMAGSSDGYSLLWILVVTGAARFIILDATARYVLVTGETVLTGCGRIGRWAVLSWMGFWVLRQHMGALGRAAMFGVAANFIFPLPTPHSAAIWGFVFLTLSFILLFWGRYKWVEEVSKPLAGVMVICLLGGVVASRPDLGDFLRGVLHPVLPSEGGRYHSGIVLMAVVSTAMGSFGNLRYSAFVHEKGWRTLDHLRSQRKDLLTGIVGGISMLAMVQIAAAGVLGPRGIRVGRVEDLVPMFGQVLGDWGGGFFGITLLCVVFGAHVGSGSGFGIMVSDVFHRFVRPSKRMIEDGTTPGEMPAYRWLMVYLSVSPLYVFFTDWTPVGIVVATGVISVVMLPVMMVIVMLLTADRKIMGRHANGWLTNTVMIGAILCALYLSWQGALEIIADLRGTGQ